MSDSAPALAAINQLRLILISCPVVWSSAKRYIPPDVSFFPDAAHQSTERGAWQLLMKDATCIHSALKRLSELAESGACEGLLALSAWHFAHKLSQVLQLTPQEEPSSSGKAARLWRCQWTRVAKAVRDWGDEPGWGWMQGELDEQEMRLQGKLSPAPTVPPPPAVQPVADGQPEAERPKPPPLTVHEQKVLDLIRARPAGTGITGRGIIDALNKQGNAPEQSTLTRHIIPKLKRWFGVENAGGGRGYFIPPT